MQLRETLWLYPYCEGKVAMCLFLHITCWFKTVSVIILSFSFVIVLCSLKVPCLRWLLFRSSITQSGESLALLYNGSGLPLHRWKKKEVRMVVPVTRKVWEQNITLKVDYMCVHYMISRCSCLKWEGRHLLKYSISLDHVPGTVMVLRMRLTIRMTATTF